MPGSSPEHTCEVCGKKFNVKYMPGWVFKKRTKKKTLYFCSENCMKIHDTKKTATKYHSKSIEYNGEKFDSKMELARFQALERMGVHSLQRQVKFKITEKMPGLRSSSYIADFTYYEGDVLIIEDVKGFKTRDYVLKKKIMVEKFCSDPEYPAIFREVKLVRGEWVSNEYKNFER